MEEEIFIDNVMAVIKKLTSHIMSPDELLKTRNFIRFTIHHELYTFRGKTPEFFVINSNQGVVDKQLSHVQDLKDHIRDVYIKAVKKGEFLSLDHSDYSDFTAIKDPKDILFNLQQVAVSRQKYERQKAYLQAKLEGRATFGVGNFNARIEPVYLDQSHQINNMQIQPEKEVDRYELVLEWMDRNEVLYADLLCNQLRIQIKRRKKRYFTALAKYLLGLRNAVAKMRQKIAARFKRQCFLVLKEEWSNVKMGKVVRMKQQKRQVKNSVFDNQIGNSNSPVLLGKNQIFESVAGPPNQLFKQFNFHSLQRFEDTLNSNTIGSTQSVKKPPLASMMSEKVQTVAKNVKVAPVEEEKKVQPYQKAVLKTITEDEWNKWSVIKEKKHIQKPTEPLKSDVTGSQYGGLTSKGTLVAGPIKQENTRFGGSGAWEPSKQKFEAVNHASAVADYDFGLDRDQTNSKFETFSHVCSTAVAQARITAKLTQAQLATKVNEKTATIVELENGHGRYNADLINRIENALKVQIPRGRKTQSKKK